uniref:Ig-like domain-containing protein n=1 Tax=Pavo cristatus TaxID=9049 RepID=A0A8C9FX68_PAVCR
MFVFLSTGPTVSGLLVKGEVGQNITVPCFYRVRTENDITSMCWGRDACPPSKCSRPIIWTDGWKVTEQYHTKYVLEGDLLKGNVSLTILNAQETDSGTYCCRVEIPGWFNDKTTNLQVVVERAPGSASEASFTVRTWLPVSLSEAPETASGSYSSTSDYPEVTSSLQNSSVSTHSQQYSENSLYLRTGLCVAFLVILVLGLFLGRRKYFSEVVIQVLLCSSVIHSCGFATRVSCIMKVSLCPPYLGPVRRRGTNPHPLHCSFPRGHCPCCPQPSQ